MKKSSFLIVIIFIIVTLFNGIVIPQRELRASGTEAPTPTPTATPTPTPTATPSPTPVAPLLDFFKDAVATLYVGNALTFHGSATIHGAVMSNFTSSNQLSFDSSSGQYISGGLYVANNQLSKNSFLYGPTKILGNVFSLPAPSSFVMPPFPTYPDQSSLPVFNSTYTAGWNPAPPYHITTDGWYKGGITIYSELIIDVGDQDRVIRTKYLRISGGGKLTINKTGAGKLIVYIDDKDTQAFVVSNGAAVNSSGNPKDMEVYFDTPSFNATGAASIKSLLYGKNADIAVGGPGVILGHIITGGAAVDFSAIATSTAETIYAPNATVTFSGGGKIRGVVVANNCVLNAGSDIEYTSLANDQSLKVVFIGESATPTPEPLYTMRIGCSSAADLLSTGDAQYDAYLNNAGATTVTVRTSYLSYDILETVMISPVTKTVSIPNFKRGRYVVSISRPGYLSRDISVGIFEDPIDPEFDWLINYMDTDNIVALTDGNFDIGNKPLVPGDIFPDGIIDGSDSEWLFQAIGSTYGDLGYEPSYDFNLDGIIDGTDSEMILNTFGLEPSWYGEAVDYFN
ncbi:MAG: hypothetical protein WCL54_04050 [Clostridia bacterium]